MELLPLGDYEPFNWLWSGNPRPWGPEGAGWRAWFGGKVIDGLCQVLDEHLAATRHPAAIGCVPWLTSKAVIDRLLKLSCCCVVLDKGALLPERLIESESGFASIALGLGGRKPDGATEDDAPLNWNFQQGFEYDVEPVRVYGWRNQKRPGKPLLHAKLLVLGEVRVDKPCPEAPYHEELDFVPQQVWFGSANWTETSKNHLEFGFVCQDPQLVRDTASFVEDVIAQSEPVGSTCAGPEPNLVYVDFGDPEPEDLEADFDEEAEWRASQFDDDEN
jgi:hypothetical protein